jgi:hypothetical protein
MVGTQFINHMLDDIGNLADQCTGCKASWSFTCSARARAQALGRSCSYSVNCVRGGISSSHLPGAAGADGCCRSVQKNPIDARHDGPLGLVFDFRSRSVA